MKLSPRLVSRSLLSHSNLGLSLGAFLYLLCLSGTLLVFAAEFERWEQPDLEDYGKLKPSAIDNALEQYAQRVETIPESIFVVLPNGSLPRAHLSADQKEWYLQSDGTLSDPVAAHWTHFLRDLHIHLHLPQTPGLILVGTLGVMLLGLVVSGVLAHPRIFKDAFRFRLGGSRRLEQADWHNRLSVWGLPFHITIALTGAFIGLLGPLAWVAANAFYQGDEHALYDDVYGADPIVEQAVAPLNIDSAFTHLADYAPQAEPIYFVVHHWGSEQQFMEIGATLPGRLIYSEIYRYQANGEFIDHQRLSDGPATRQMAYSVYRLHFGQYGGLWVKWAYLFLGLALTIVSVTGINIWLARSKQNNHLVSVWCTIVWGLPLAFAATLLASVIFKIDGLPIFLGTWLLAVFLSTWLHPAQHIQRTLNLATAGCLLCTVAVHGLLHPNQFTDTYIVLIHGMLIVTAMLIGALRFNPKQLKGLRIANASINQT